MSEISKRTKSENERINLLVFIFATLMDAFFVVGYLQDASVGNISWTYAIIVVAVVAVGLLINAVLIFVIMEVWHCVIRLWLDMVCYMQ